MRYIVTVSTLALLAACETAPTSDIEDAASAAEAVTEVEDAAPEAAPEETTEVAGLCLNAGPQTPRDISSVEGLNTVTFPKAPTPSEMNLCNIHSHTNAEHKGPGYSLFVDATDNGGYACNGTPDLTEAELASAPGAYQGVVPGQTIEVHWVHTSCEATPGEGLGACVPEGCTDPLLRVEAQTFLVVNDPEALNFMDMAYGGNVVDGKHQAKMIPGDTGTPVTFLGSTTGPSYDQSTCSPAQVTWSVRPDCAKLDINSLHAWAESGNVFNETKSHGVRQLVTAPELLSPIGAE
ncbi:MAG: delta-class carbonic anhydrase [Pseudomonadota bacterium]